MPMQVVKDGGFQDIKRYPGVSDQHLPETLAAVGASRGLADLVGDAVGDQHEKRVPASNVSVWFVKGCSPADAL